MDKEGSLFVHYIKVLAIGLLAAIILHTTIWQSNICAIHSLIEAMCVFIGGSIFLIVWNTMNKISNSNHIIGFGFLFVAVFDAFHIYIYIAQLASRHNLLDLSMKSWVLGRLSEAIVLYLVTLNVSKIKINKWIALSLTVFFSFGINLVAFYFPHAFPIVSTASGLTLIKRIAECIVIFFAVLSLMNLRKIISDKTSVFNRCLFMSLLIMIPAEIMFTVYASEYELAFVYGHILKMLYYYYLYKAVYVSSIEHPYDEIRLENIKLDEVYRQLEDSKQEELRRQDMLMQQEKLALLGQMGVGIVHETRNYLTTIKGSCQLAELLAKEEGALKYLKKINKNVDEIDRIMSKFLFMSKPRETAFEEVSMCDLIQSVQSLIMSTSLIKKVEVFFEVSKEERYLICDEGQINQVILNLCKNAVEAMEDIPNAKLNIETGYDEAANEMYISVRDNGRGISDDNLEEIGKPFFTTKNSGTGLGLYVCYQIIEEHNGRFEVSSELGKGTSFTIKLPCLNEDEEEEEEITNNVC